MSTPVMPRITDATSGTPTEPMTYSEAKTHCRIPSATTADDTYITALIVAARQAAEHHTRLALVAKTLVAYLDAWPGASDIWWDGVREGPIELLYEGKRWITMPFPPLVAVSAITVYDDSDAAVTFSSTNYYVDAVDAGAPGRIVLRRGAVWPPALRVANAIKIAFTAGYGTPGPTIPADIKQAIGMIVEFLYRNRGDATEASAMAALQVCGASVLLDNYIIRKF